MASVVLAGLLYIFVELYLDDVFVHATSDEEFLERLRIVFERFRQFNITLNPKKYCFGMEEVDFNTGIVNYDLFGYLPNFTQLDPSPFTNLYRTLREFTAFTGNYRSIQIFTGNYRSIQIFTGIYGSLREFTDH